MGRRDIARRRLTGAGAGTGGRAGARATSEPELAGGRAAAGFPPGTTVDELHWYSRRRPTDNTRVRDNLYLESGSLKDITSEYTRSFQAPPPEAARSLGDLTADPDEAKKKVIGQYSSQSEDIVGKIKSAVPSQAYSQFRRPPKQEGLRLEGDMLFQTEKRDQFIEYVLSKRPDLLRRDTQLKLEGDLYTLTENQEKFISYENCKRPSLAKRDTNLHLEGDLLYFPEYKDVYVDFPRHRPVTIKPSPWLQVESDGKMDFFSETLSKFTDHAICSKRPEGLRRPSTLKCEGEFSLVPEYKESFKEYPIERRRSIKQPSNLKLEGELYITPEYKEKYISFPNLVQNNNFPLGNPQVDDPTVQISNPDEISLEKSSPSNTPNLLLKPEGNLNVSTDQTPKKSKPPTPRRVESPKFTSNDTKLLNKTNMKGSIRDYCKSNNSPRSNTPIEDRLTTRPPKSRRSRTYSQTANSCIRNSQEKLINDNGDRADNNNYDLEGKTRVMRRPESLMMDNKFESQPEYRKAYVDYLVREKLPRSRQPDDTTEVVSPLVNLNWIKRKDDPNNSSFHLVCSKGTKAEEKRLGPINAAATSYYKPTSRRASTSSVHSSPRLRSTSPSYRLHVTNVDEPKKGFGSKPPLPKSEKVSSQVKSRSSSPKTHSKPSDILHQYDNNYSNSTGRRQWNKTVMDNNRIIYDNNVNNIDSGKSFVVLDKSDFVGQRVYKESPWYRNAYL